MLFESNRNSKTTWFWNVTELQLVEMESFRVVLCLAFLGSCVGFLGSGPLACKRRQKLETALQLVPIKNIRPECTFLSESDENRYCFDKNGTFLSDVNNDPPFELSLVQEEDLPDVARFVVNAFGADVISLSKDFNRFEKALMKPTVGLLNAYSGVVAYMEVLAGLQSRTKDRIDNPTLAKPNIDKQTKSKEEQLLEAQKSSLVLAVGRPSQGSDWHIDVIASVELRLEPCDAKIPFSFPFLDRIERRLASLLGNGVNGNAKLRPYLSNLCVDESYRGKQLGKALVRCVEDITQSWGYDKLFLHVDLENEAARTLYERAGYRDAKKRWKPFWAGPAAKIGYYVKKFEKNNKEKKRRKSKEVQHVSVVVPEQ